MAADVHTRKLQQEGRRAAYGRRQPRRAWMRGWLIKAFRILEARVPARDFDYVHFTPAVRSPAELADLTARVNWYLPASNRDLPVHVSTNLGLRPDPKDAPHMDPALVDGRCWSTDRPTGRAMVVVHRLTIRSLVSYTLNLGRAMIVSPNLHYSAEAGLFDLHRRICTTKAPDPAASIISLLSRHQAGASVLVLATGPSASAIDPERETADLRIICNSAVRNHDLVRELQPDVIAFTDPIFHCGPSRYAAQFRDDLLASLEICNALMLTSTHYVGPLLSHNPGIASRLVVFGDAPVTSKDNRWRWPSPTDPTVRPTHNVLTYLMLPAAFALGDVVHVAGCDGRKADEKYFWAHNKQTQYDDALMHAIFQAHPAFFRDRDYRDYYEQHCTELEELLGTAEGAGKKCIAVTPSHIPALRRRGAPPFPSAAVA